MSMEAKAEEASRTLVITRIFNAPPRLVYLAWSKPEHLVRWFGPSDFTLPTCEQDFRVGGAYCFCMRAPEGGEHWVKGEYLEISAYDRIAFTWIRSDGLPEPWVDNVVTLTFEDLDGRTKFTMHHAFFNTTSHRDEHNGGWSECNDRLATFLDHYRTP